MKKPELKNLEVLKSGNYRDKTTGIVYSKAYIKTIKEVEKDVNPVKQPAKTKPKTKK